MTKLSKDGTYKNIRLLIVIAGKSKEKIIKTIIRIIINIYIKFKNKKLVYLKYKSYKIKVNCCKNYL